MIIMDEFLQGKLNVGYKCDEVNDKQAFLKVLDKHGIKWHSGHKASEWDSRLVNVYYTYRDGGLVCGFGDGDISIKEFLKEYKEE